MLFDGRNHLVWQRRMYNALALQDLLHTTVCPLPGSAADSSLRDDRKARSIINSTLSDAVLRSIPARAHADAHTLLSYLEDTYTKSSALIAMRDFKGLRCAHTTNEGPAAHLSSVQDYLVRKAGLRREASASVLMSGGFYCRDVIVNLGSEYRGIMWTLCDQMDTLFDHPDAEELLHAMVIDAFDTFHCPEYSADGHPRMPKGKKDLVNVA